MAFGSKQNAAVIRESPASRLNLSSSLHPYASFTSSSTSSPSSPSSSPAPLQGTCRAPTLIPCKSGNGRGSNGGWIEALTASSPTHSRTSRVNPFDWNLIDAELHNSSWLLRHPSALTFFDRIMEAAHGKQIAVFLDYDGTLSPIVKNPDLAFISDMMRATVKDVAVHFPAAIISGRSRDKVYDFVQLHELYYAGSHGMDIMGPAEGHNGVKANGTKAFDVNGNKVILFQPASDIPIIIEKVCRQLQKKTRDIDGVRVENNKFCATVHFRCVKEEDWDTLAQHVGEVVQFYPNLCLTQGRKVLEIRPSIAWNKGKALEFLLNALGLGCRNDVFPVYIGDDQTDEDAFRVLKEKGVGLSIIVSSAPKDTSALYSLHDPPEVMDFLRRLVNWRINRSNGSSHPCTL